MTTCCTILLFYCSKQFDHVIMMCFILNMNSVMKICQLWTLFKNMLRICIDYEYDSISRILNLIIHLRLSFISKVNLQKIMTL